MPEFVIPPRGRYEANATIFQKRKLEEYAARIQELTPRFYEILDGLGREQADYIIKFCVLKEVAQYEAAQRAAQNLALHSSLPDETQRHGMGCLAQSLILLIGIPFMIYVVLAATGQLRTSVADSTTTPIHSPPIFHGFQPGSLQPIAKPSPAFTPYTPAPDAFRTDVTYSRQAAAMKHSTVGIPGSPLNKAYVTRLKEWQAAHDPRLDRSDWPEKLADDCAAHP